MKKASLILIIIFCAALAATARATGLSVQPASLEVSGVVGRPAAARLHVQNPSNTVALFEAYPDEFDSFITIAPAQFILEAGEQKDVAVQITPGAVGVFQTSVSVVSRPLAQADTALSVGSGVKIPLRITVAARPAGFAALVFQNWGISAGAAVILAAFGAVLVRRRRTAVQS